MSNGVGFAHDRTKVGDMRRVMLREFGFACACGCVEGAPGVFSEDGRKQLILPLFSIRGGAFSPPLLTGGIEV